MEAQRQPPDCPDWWDEEVEMLAEEAWLPVAQDFCQRSGEPYSRCIHHLAGKSFVGLRNLTNHSLRGAMPVELLPENLDIDSSIKIELSPTPEERCQLRKMFGAFRFVYNKLVDLVGDDWRRLSQAQLRADYRPVRSVTRRNLLTDHLPDWVWDVPQKILDAAFTDFLKTITTTKAGDEAARNNGENRRPSELHFKTRKNNSTSIEIQVESFGYTGHASQARFLPNYFGWRRGSDEGIATKEDFPEPTHAVRLQSTRLGKFYLCVPRHVDFAQSTTLRVCAIDPGVRDFISLYDPTGLAMAIYDAENYVYKRCLAIDHMKSQLAHEGGKRRRY